MTPVTRRSELLSLLSEACELEHALACSYLFAAFSIRQGPEDGLTWQQQQLARGWAAQVYFVASQEMLHLAQAWNLLAAIGGTPYYDHERFPHPKGYYPISARLSLEKCDVSTIERFVTWETPRKKAPAGSSPTGSRYRSVGELYDLIRTGFETIPEPDLFVGDPRLQIDRATADFADLVPVRCLADAHAAISAIQLQGEGTEADHLDCHYGMFLKMRDDMKCAGFDVAREVVANPATLAGPHRTVVAEPNACAAMNLFDDLYALMLRMLAWVFGPGDPSARETAALARAAIVSMPVVIKPLGEALTTFVIKGGRAGAAFDLHRHVQLPATPQVALRLATERIEDLFSEASVLAKTMPALAWLPRQLGVLSAILAAAK